MNLIYRNFFRSFLRAQEGSIVVMVGLSALVLVMVTGIAIDGERMEMLQAKMQSALDATSLAVAQAASQGTLTCTSNSTTCPMAQAYFNMNFPPGYLGSAPITVSTQLSGNTVTVAAQTTESMSMMQIAGVTSMPVAAVSESQYSQAIGCGSTIGTCTNGSTVPISINGGSASWECGILTCGPLTLPQCGLGSGSVGTCNPGVASAISNNGTNTTWACALNGATTSCSDGDPVCGSNIDTCSSGTLSGAHGTSTIDTWTCTSTKGATSSCSATAPQCGSTVNTCAAGIVSSASKDGTTYLWSCSLNGATLACNSYEIPACKNGIIYGCSSGSTAINESAPGTVSTATWQCENMTSGVVSATCSTPATQCGYTIDTCTNSGGVSGQSNNGTSSTWLCFLNGQTIPTCSDADPVCNNSIINGCSSGSTAINKSTPGTVSTTTWQCQSNSTGTVSTTCSATATQCGSTVNTCTNNGLVSLSTNNGSYSAWDCALNGQTINCSDADPTCSTTTINGCWTGGTAINESTPGASSTATWQCENTSTDITSSQCSLPATQCGSSLNTCSNGGTANSEVAATANDTDSIWSCTLNGQTVSGCSAELQDAVCGSWSSSWKGSVGMGTCSTGTLDPNNPGSTDTATGQITWNCLGINGGTNAACVAQIGVCGTVPGQCLGGTLAGLVPTKSIAMPYPYTYVTDWPTPIEWSNDFLDTWTCQGSNGGADASSCSAPDGTFTTPDDSCFVALGLGMIGDNNYGINGNAFLANITSNDSTEPPNYFGPQPVLFSTLCQDISSEWILPKGLIDPNLPSSICLTNAYNSRVNYLGAGAAFNGPTGALYGTNSGFGTSFNYNTIMIGPSAHVTIWGVPVYEAGVNYGYGPNNSSTVMLNLHGPAMVYNSCWLFGEACDSGYGNPDSSFNGGPYPGADDILAGDAVVFRFPEVDATPLPGSPLGGTNSPQWPQYAPLWNTYWNAQQAAAQAYFNTSFGTVTGFDGSTIDMQAMFPPSVRYWSGSAVAGQPPQAPAAGSLSMNTPFPGDMVKWQDILITCDPEPQEAYPGGIWYPSQLW
jgi:Flp pilus assembly protein TadG